MIQKFNQYINESTIGQNPLSVHEIINDEYSSFITRAEDRLEMMKYKITEILAAMDKAVESVVEEFGDIIVGEPQIIVENDLSEIEVKLNTTIPHDDNDWEGDDDSPAEVLERKLDDLFYKKEPVKINVEIFYKPNADGNCIIRLHTYVIDVDIFGDFTDTFATMGEKY